MFLNYRITFANKVKLGSDGVLTPYDPYLKFHFKEQHLS